MPSIELIQAIMVTSELCGRTFSEAAATVFVEDLATYPQAQVLKALVRCRREVRGALTLQDVISRMEDGRPGVEEAWAMLPHSEGDSAVWTTEMSQAFSVCVGLIDSGDMVAARMAFKEAYLFQVCQARDAGNPVEWHVTLGHDVRGREAVLIAAVDKGRISYEKAQEFIPSLPMKDGRVADLLAGIAGTLRITA